MADQITSPGSAGFSDGVQTMAPVGPTYIALTGLIRRDTDGQMGARWGLVDAATGQPVTTGGPGPWTWTHPTGHVWRHVGRGADLAEHRLWYRLDDVEAWARDNGAHALVVGRQRLVFRRVVSGG